MNKVLQLMSVCTQVWGTPDGFHVWNFPDQSGSEFYTVQLLDLEQRSDSSEHQLTYQWE